MSTHNSFDLFEAAKEICCPPANLNYYPFEPPKHYDDTVDMDGVSRAGSFWPHVGPRHVVGDDNQDDAA